MTEPNLSEQQFRNALLLALDKMHQELVRIRELLEEEEEEL